MGPVWTIATGWSFDPVLGTAILATGAAYVAAARRVSARSPDNPWPRRYTVSFLTALVLAWVALLGPFGTYDDTYFWAHMMQHILLTMLVAPLMLLGAPVLLVLRVSTRAVRRRWIVPMLRSRVAHALTNPLVGWVLFAGMLIATHFSPFYEFCLTHNWAHRFLEHPIFLLFGLVYYYPLLPGNPGPRRVGHGIRVLSLFSMMTPETLTGFFIYATGYVMYRHYATVHRPFGPSALRDQQWGGALMWSGSMLIDAVWVTLAARDWLQNEREVARRIDLDTMRQLAISSPRP